MKYILCFQNIICKHFMSYVGSVCATLLVKVSFLFSTKEDRLKHHLMYLQIIQSIKNCDHLDIRFSRDWSIGIEIIQSHFLHVALDYKPCHVFVNGTIIF